jgi:uncharacterized membrane protein YgdD (TMEM256/DUF423 family)
MNRLYWQIGAISGALSVALGAFGGTNLIAIDIVEAHGLKKRVTNPELLKTWETAG